MMQVHHEEGVREPQARETVKETHANPAIDLMEYVKAYARERPMVTALVCFGAGFVIGWKLKPW